MARHPRLQPETQAWYRQIVERWVLDAHHLRILQHAGEAWDVPQRARETVEREGMTVPAAGGGVKAHPLLAEARTARAQFAALLAQIDLDGDVSTPGGGR